MKRKMIVVISSVLLIGLALAGVAYAQTIPAFRYETLNELDNVNTDVDEDFEAVCTGDVIHPVLQSLADEYGFDYDDLLDYFCEDEFGIGEIMLALETAKLENVKMSYAEILGKRFDGDQKEVGWGLIWQEMGLIGRGKPDHGETMELGEGNQVQEQEENNPRKPVVPPGLSGELPGKGRGPKK